MYEWIEQGTMRDRRPLLITTMFGQLINMISWLHNVCHRSWFIYLVGKLIKITNILVTFQKICHSSWGTPNIAVRRMFFFKNQNKFLEGVK